MVIGRTRDFAYTITSGISDQVDTYLEVLNTANAKQYLFNGAYEDMSCRTETFTVREPPPPAGSGGAPMTVQREFCRTRHGPVFFRDNRVAFSHAYAHRNLELLSAANWLRMAQATNLSQFKTLVDGESMSFNYHYADNAGTIAYFHAGIRPLRPNRSDARFPRSEEHTSELQSRFDLVCRLLLEKKKTPRSTTPPPTPSGTTTSGRGCSELLHERASLRQALP